MMKIKFCWMWIFLFICLSAGAAEIISPQSWQVIQRDKDGKGDIPIILKAEKASKVSARILKDSKVIVPWKSCEIKSKDKLWKAELQGVPQGGWYTLELNIDGKIFRIDNVGVGIIIGVIGQSNASGYSGGPPYAKPSLMTSVYRACGIFEKLQDPTCRPGPQGDLTEEQKNDPEIKKYLSPDPNFKRKFNYLDWGCTASCWPEFSKLMADYYKVPVMIVPGSRGSASSAQWLPTEKNWLLYQNMIKQVKAVGGKVSAIIVNQGEQDCRLNEKAYEVWMKNTGTYVNAFRKDLNDSNLPFLFVQIGVYSEWSPAIRQAIDDFCLKDKNCYLAACAYDLPGGIHYAKKGMTILAGRLFNAYRNIVGGENEVSFSSPKATDIKLSPSRDKIIISFSEPVTGLEGQHQAINLDILGDKDAIDFEQLEKSKQSITSAMDEVLKKRVKNIEFKDSDLIINLQKPLASGNSFLIIRYGYENSTKKYPGAMIKSAKTGLPATQFSLKLDTAKK